MPHNPNTPVVRAWVRLVKAQQLALTSVEAALKAAGLPPLGWYDVLLEVERAGTKGLRPVELEQAVLLAQYNLSRLIDRLERAGYVERKACEADGRGQLIVLTAAGRTVRQKMWPVYARGIEAAVGRHLSAREVLALDGLLGKLVEGNAAD